MESLDKRRSIRFAPAFAVLAAAGFAFAQAPSKDPGNLKFEVASFKPAAPGGRGGFARPDPGGVRYRGSNLPLRQYMIGCYRLRGDQILNAPGWVDSENYDVLAEAPKPSTVEEMYLMMRNLLIDRCHLAFHIENREMPIYTLGVDPVGIKMKPHDPANGEDPFFITQSWDSPFHARWIAKGATIDILTGRLSRSMDRPVMDMTELKGDYDFVLTYTMEPPPNLPPGAKINGEPIDLSGPTIFQAVRQQLGLRLDARKGPAPVMIIDHIDKPTAN